MKNKITAAGYDVLTFLISIGKVPDCAINKNVTNSLLKIKFIQKDENNYLSISKLGKETLEKEIEFGKRKLKTTKL